jgi:hypothetical protein
VTRQGGPKGFELVGEADPEPGPREPISFTTFALSLSASALLHLGERPDDALGLALDAPAELNLPACQQIIDILEMLRSKTRGNLSPEEGQLLDRVLHDLHLRYVEARRRSRS